MAIPTLKKIRVLVVDDSMLARGMIINGLNTHPRIEVVGYAINALDAKNKIPQLKPDVITMDVEMPGINGIDFLKQYLPTNPLPVILVSSLNLKVFDALAAGAVDFVRKPDGQRHVEAFIAALAQKQLSRLKGCGAHFTVVLSDVDENLYKRLGMHVSYEAKYERQRLYYK